MTRLNGGGFHSFVIHKYISALDKIEKATFLIPAPTSAHGYPKHLQLTEDEQTLYAFLNVQGNMNVVKFRTADMSGVSPIGSTKYWTF